jgi:DHA1 family multidrug resistance protein-like MFS transporter
LSAEPLGTTAPSERANPRPILFAVLFGTFIYTSGSGFLTGGLGPAGRAIGLSEIDVGIVLSTGALATVVAAPVWGFVSERWSRRLIAFIAIVMVSIAPAAMALVFGLAAGLSVGAIQLLLIGARLLQAGFGAALVPVSQSFIAQFTGAGRRVQGMGLMSVVATFGTVSGSALLYAVAKPGVAVGFAAIAGLGVIAFVLALVLLPEVARPPTASAPDQRAVPLRRIWANVAITVIGYWSFTMVQPLIGFRLMDKFGFDTAEAVGQAGLILAGATLALVGSQAVIAILGKWRASTMLLFGSIGVFIGLCGLVAAPDVMWMVLAMIAVGLSLGFVVPANLGMISLATGSGAQGKVSGINTAVRGVGIALGPITGTVLYRLHMDAPFYASAALVVIVIVLAVISRRLSTDSSRLVQPA